MRLREPVEQENPWPRSKAAQENTRFLGLHFNRCKIVPCHAAHNDIIVRSTVDFSSRVVRAAPGKRDSLMITLAIAAARPPTRYRAATMHSLGGRPKHSKCFIRACDRGIAPGSGAPGNVFTSRTDAGR